MSKLHLTPSNSSESDSLSLLSTDACGAGKIVVAMASNQTGIPPVGVDIPVEANFQNVIT